MVSQLQDSSDASMRSVLQRVQLNDDGYLEIGAPAEPLGLEHTERRQPEGLPVSAISRMQAELLSSSKTRLALTAMGNNDPREVLTSAATTIADQHVFNVQIPLEGAPITNQRRSGRCWLFASTNCFRVALMERYNLDSFELSQAYLFYYDKLEKSNWFLEQIMDTAHEDLDGRLVQTLLGDIVSDGGQWDMVYNLVDKYGLVPQALYPDNWSAMNSGVLNTVVKTKLREFALQLRGMCRGDEEQRVTAVALSEAKARMMKEITLILTVMLGQPPSPDEAFTWQYTDKAKQYRELKIKPREFAKNISSRSPITLSTIKNMVSLVNDPRHDYLSLLTVSRLGNVVGGRAVQYINVDMETLKRACVHMLRSGVPVFFGSDVGQFSSTTAGVMDTSLYDYDLAFNTSLLGLSKSERLLTGESQMTHAMVLTGVHVDEKTGGCVRWRVQNSWGEGAGQKGWFVMGDSWMDEFVYQAVVDVRFCPKEVQAVLGQEAKVLPLWDPMGSLA